MASMDLQYHDLSDLILQWLQWIYFFSELRIFMKESNLFAKGVLQ